MVTRREHRRKGAATHVLHSLACWGREHGASEMYLQVMEDNAAALPLYARAGFEKVYQYWYSSK
jgi:GNAT superfamily N-acetyltransferase